MLCYPSNLLVYLKKSGLTQVELFEQTGIHQSRLSLVLNENVDELSPFQAQNLIKAIKFPGNKSQLFERYDTTKHYTRK